MPHVQLAAATAALALAFRGLAVASLTLPHWIPLPVAQYLVPAAFVAYLVGWFGIDHALQHSKVVAVKAVTHRTTLDGEPLTRAQRKKRRAGGEARKVSKEVLIKREGEDELHPVDKPADNLPEPSGPAMVLGIPTLDRTRNRMALVANVVLLLIALDHAWTTKLFLGNEDLTYARTTALSPTTATVAFRAPGDASYLEYRALDSADWLSQPLLTASDYRGEAKIEHLIPGLTYEYRIHPHPGSYNFTTFPDPQLARETGSHFRFIQTGAPAPPQPWTPMTLPTWNPFSTPHTTPTPSHVAHAWRAHKLRQPALRELADWLADMRQRVAWSQYAFGITSGRLEEFGNRESALGMKSKDAERKTRQLLASRDVRDVYEVLPLLPLAEHSQGSKLEPAALGEPSQTFSYADTAFYRLRKPYHSRADGDGQDWQTEVDSLSRWLSGVNRTTSFKFILSSESLSPFWPAKNEDDEVWRDQVLDLLEFVPNVIVLSERSQGWGAFSLRENVIEIATPALDSPRWTNPTAPDVSLAHEVVVSSPVKVHGHRVEQIEFKKLDRVLRWVPGEPGTKWTSIEVDTRTRTPIAIVEFYTASRRITRLEIVGSPRRRASNAVGQVGEGFLAMLRRFGLLPW